MKYRFVLPFGDARTAAEWEEKEIEKVRWRINQEPPRLA
jgi:hypothetical protein